MSFNIEVEGGTSVRLPTAGKYCDRDIVITASGGDSGNAIDNLIDKSITEITSNATRIGAYALYNCSALTTANFPLATSIGNNAFSVCSSLTKIDFPLVTSIGNNAFYNVNLTTVILRSESICSLSNVNAFSSTPIASGTGYVYVPDALVEQYKTATNWTTYANQIKPISELEG